MKVIALLLLCLPALTLGNFENCEAFVNFPNETLTGYNSYIWEPGTTAGSCVGAQQSCQTEFPQNNLLRDRSWFITDNKDVTGLFYNRQALQLANVQCPDDTWLHLFPQFLQTEGVSIGLPNCEQVDFVRVTHEDLMGGEEVFCGDDDERQMTTLFNGGLGLVTTSNSAMVEFCTNSNADVGIPAGVTARSLLRNSAVDSADGFIVRATCIDPSFAFQTGCADYQFFRDWDPEWLALQNMPYSKPDTAEFPHKRSVEDKALTRSAMKKGQERLERQTHRRMKRFADLAVYEFDGNSSAVFEMERITITYGNGTVFTPDLRFPCILATSVFFGQRKFYIEAPFTFRGPGSLTVDGSQRLPVLEHTVDISNPIVLQEVLVPDPEAMNIVNNIYEYIFNCWIRPFPIIHRPAGSRVVNLPSSKDVNLLMQLMRQRIDALSRNPDTSDNAEPPRFPQIIGTDGLGFLQESFWPVDGVPQANTCYRGTLLRAAPLVGQQTEELIRSFCNLFIYACDPLIRIACEEFNRLSS